MKKRTLLIFIALVVLPYPPLSGLAQPMSADAQALRDLLTSCDHPCFIGIEVDVTTKAEVMGIFSTMGIGNYNELDAVSPGGGSVWSWVPDGSQRFVNDGTRSDSIAWITFHGDDIVRQINVPLEVSLTTVTEAFGAPDAIRESPSSNENSRGYYLVYRKDRLVFTVITLYGLDTVVNVFLVSSVFEGNMIDDPIGMDVSQVCSSYGTPPCIVATATETPTPTHTPTPTLTPFSDGVESGLGN